MKKTATPLMKKSSKPTAMPRVVIADDHSVVRFGLRKLLESSGFRVVGEAEDGQEALRVINRVETDLLILDLSMPEMNGLACARQVRQLNPVIKIVLFSMYTSPAFVRDAMTAGVSAFVTKSDVALHLLSVLWDLYRRPAGEFIVPQQRLGPVQRLIVARIREGFTEQEIAQELDVPESRVKDILERISQLLQGP